MVKVLVRQEQENYDPGRLYDDELIELRQAAAQGGKTEVNARLLDKVCGYFAFDREAPEYCESPEEGEHAEMVAAAIDGIGRALAALYDDYQHTPGGDDDVWDWAAEESDGIEKRLKKAAADDVEGKLEARLNAEAGEWAKLLGSLFPDFPADELAGTEGLRADFLKFWSSK